MKIKYVFECACISAKRVQAGLRLFRCASLSWRGHIGCFHPKKDAARIPVRTRRLVVSMEYVHGRHYDTLFAASGVENSPLMDRPFIEGAWMSTAKRMYQMKVT